MNAEEIEGKLKEFVAALKHDGADEEVIGRVMNELSERIYYALTPDEP